MVYFRSKDGKVILNLALFPLDFLLQYVDVFLFVAEQEYKIVREDISMISH
jgi:hypothetical protein